MRLLDKGRGTAASQRKPAFRSISRSPFFPPFCSQSHSLLDSPPAVFPAPAFVLPPCAIPHNASCRIEATISHCWQEMLSPRFQLLILSDVLDQQCELTNEQFFYGAFDDSWTKTLVAVRKSWILAFRTFTAMLGPGASQFSTSPIIIHFLRLVKWVEQIKRQF